jgi:hypothetical protein
MSKANIGRTILAILGGYLVNAILVAGSEQFLLPALGGDATPSLYFVVDLITQCLYTVIGGYLCSAIAGANRRVAIAGMISLGVLVGTASLISSWKAEPHWYAIALLAVYPPCAWIGMKLRGISRSSDS